MALSNALPQSVTKRLYAGKRHSCPVCRSDVAFFRSWDRMEQAWCPVCLAFKWHRMAWLYLERKTDLFDGRPKKLLHFAPEPAFEQRFREVDYLDYMTADYFEPNVMVKMDIMDIQYPDASFDVIYCSHVLEHVPDPPLAMRELSRVLTADGWAVIAVPLSNEATIGDPSETDPLQRERRFGQHDHLWLFGTDFPDLLAANGFEVTAIHPKDVANEAECERFSFRGIKPIFFCRKA